jgi:hypothetical protein
MAIGRMRIAYWITKATDKHSEYVAFIALPLQQWLHEPLWRLRYTYITCLVINSAASGLDVQTLFPNALAIPSQQPLVIRICYF